LKETGDERWDAGKKVSFWTGALRGSSGMRKKLRERERVQRKAAGVQKSGTETVQFLLDSGEKVAIFGSLGDGTRKRGLVWEGRTQSTLFGGSNERGVG